MMATTTVQHRYFIRALEDCSLPAEQFDHGAHVRAAWYYLHRRTFADACQHFTKVIKCYATSLGQAQKYHATLTQAWLTIIAKRLCSSPSLDWDAFVMEHADLVEHPKALISHYYSPQLLASNHAREHFVAPDRHALPPKLDSSWHRATSA